MSVVPVSESSICHSHDGHEHDMSEETSCIDNDDCHMGYTCYSGQCINSYCVPATAPVDGVVEVGKGHINPNEE